MKEVYGDVWSYPADYICITTNGSIRQDGAAVMGRGVALQAKEQFPGIEFVLGRMLNRWGIQVYFLDTYNTILAFPVKYHWQGRADLDLIQKSADALRLIANKHPDKVFVLPRPGCGNGRLTWSQVKPILERAELPDNVHAIDRKV